MVPGRPSRSGAGEGQLELDARAAASACSASMREKSYCGPLAGGVLWCASGSCGTTGCSPGFASYRIGGVLERGLARHPTLLDEDVVVLERELHRAARPARQQGEGQREQGREEGERAGHLERLSASVRVRSRRARRLCPQHFTRRTPFRPGGRGPARAVGAGRLGAGVDQGRFIEPPRPVVAAGCWSFGGRSADDPRLRCRRDRSAGDEVVVHSVISSPDWRGDETLDPGDRSCPSAMGTFAQRVAVPRATSCRSLRSSPSRRPRACRRLADRLPDAVHAGRGLAGVDPPGAGRGRRCRDRVIVLGRAAGLRVWTTPRRRKAFPRARARCRRRLRAGARLPERVDAVPETVGAATWVTR